MDKLYAPWRDRYVHQAIKNGQVGACVFCDLFNNSETDEQRFVLWKNSEVMVVLNLYPYNGGHLLVVPKSHVAQFHELSHSELQILMGVVAKASKIVQDVLQCQGINFGANIGKIAGAGIPDHVHMHIVPRFSGDTGFFTTVGNAKQISVDLEKIYKKLKPLFDKTFCDSEL